MSVLEGFVYAGHNVLEFHSDGSPYDSFCSDPVPDPETGGVTVKATYYNCGDKAIKYLIYVLVPYNRVGDIVASEIGDETEVRCKVTGPIHPGADPETVIWEAVWYNSTISRVKVIEVNIQYMDGTEETIKGEDIKFYLDDDSEYNKARPKEPAKKSGGCYVATAVYGSYDCPQVWTLRRYRDFTLAETWYGRTFIHMYYAISPTVVKYFGDTRAFKDFFRPRLDKFVDKLNAEGVLNIEYDDRKW